MQSQFIPEFHLIESSKKLNATWFKTAIDYYYHNNNVKSLLWNKDLQKIEEYATGDIQMDQFKSMYKSMKKKIQEKRQAGDTYFNATPDLEIENLIFQALPLIQNKLNAAIALTQKIPIEITCNASDALAMKKRKEDIEFLKNKPALEADMQDLADQMDIGKVDLGTTKHSATKFGDSPFGLDLNNPDDEKSFQLFYALAVETAMEEALTTFKDIKTIQQLRLLETKDQYKYGVSVNRAFTSSITGLPDAEYVFPGDMIVPYSKLPDYSDNNARFWQHNMTVEEVFNFLSDEIGTKEDMLTMILNGAGGYAENNKIKPFEIGNFRSQKIRLMYCEIKSIDYVGISANPKSKRGVSSFTEDPKQMTSKIYGQNTYTAWWIFNTPYFYKVEKLDYAHRTKGKESYQNFSTNIYKSNEKSAVELSIGENVKAQIAEIKMNYAVVMAKADGVYIDIRGLRNAVSGLKDAGQEYTTSKLLELAMEKNVFIADTEGFEGKNDGQFKPIIPIEGGVKNIQGYLQVQMAADQKINQFIGTNDSLTGMSANPDALIGVEKLRIDASINALYYVTEALERQQQKLYTIWGSSIQQSIAAGGKVREGMIDYLGLEDIDLLQGLDETPLHNLTIKITLTQREEERMQFKNNLNILKAQGAINMTDEYLLSAIMNPKRKFAELARIENRQKKEAEKQREEQFQQNQQLQDQRNQGMVGQENARTEGNVKLAYAKGDVESKILQLSSQLGLNAAQTDFLIKRALQQDRGNDQYRKSIATVRERQDAKMLEPLAIQ